MKKPAKEKPSSLSSSTLRTALSKPLSQVRIKVTAAEHKQMMSLAEVEDNFSSKDLLAKYIDILGETRMTVLYSAYELGMQPYVEVVESGDIH